MSLSQLGARTQTRVGGKLLRSDLWAYLNILARTMPGRVTVVLALMLGTGLTESLSLLMLLPMLQIVGLEVGEGSIGQLAGLVERAFAALGLQPTVLTVIGLYVAVVSTRALLARWRSVAAFSLEQDFVAHLRLRFYEAITRANWLFYARTRSATFSHMLISELIRVGTATHILLSLLITSLITFVYLLIALLLAPLMTLLVIACGAVLSLLLLGKTRLARDKGESLSQVYENMYTAIHEHLAGMKTSKSHGIEGQHVEVFSRMISQVAKAHLGITANFADVAFWFTVGSAAILGFMLFMALEVLALPAAGILLLLFLFARLIPMLLSLQQGYQSFLSMLPAFSNLVNWQARCEAAAEARADISKDFRLQHQIRFEGVSFSYGRAESGATLHHLNLTIQTGKTTAVVGPSGAGKSTVADLVVGLIAPDWGRVLVDGETLGPERIKSWREQIGYVAQDTFLFHDSIRENLLSTCPGASSEDIAEALKLAAADEIFARLPQGLETVVGDRGVLLSGGERQRLALARALLRKPSLLILDEATSSLDSENEQRIKSAIDKLRGKMTLLVIAHRLSTIRNADVIYVLEQGRLVEFGNWETLIRQESGRFHALCRAQGLVEEAARDV